MRIGTHAFAVRTTIGAAVLALSLAPTVLASESSSNSASGPLLNIGTVTKPAIAASAAGITPTNPTGKFASFDISWVDNARHVYYLADRSNNAVDMIDATDGAFIKFLGQGQFAGVVTVPAGTGNQSGPDGVVTDKDGKVWVGDGIVGGPGGANHSTLKELDPDTGALLANIDIGGSGRADELAFGNVGGGRILIANPNEPTNSFATLVNTQTRSIIGKVIYDEPAHAGLPAVGHGFATYFAGSQHGLEQPAYVGGRFYLNVPATIQNQGGEIDVFNANSAEIVNIIPLVDCGGTGLAVSATGDLIVECANDARVITRDGQIEATIAELGGADEIWFNPGDNKAYFPLPANAKLRGAAPAGIGILDLVGDTSLGLIAVDGAQGLHSIAVSAIKNRVFLPSSDNPDNGAGGVIMLQRQQTHP